MKLNPIRLKDKAIFDKFLNARKPEKELSVFAFENIYIWKKLYDIRWQVVDKCLCVFFKDKFGCFLYLPLLGKEISRQTVETAFEVMDGFNKNKEISRIENLQEEDVEVFKDMGYCCGYKSCDYICLRKNLAALQGDSFKSKRAARNYFIKNYDYDFVEYSSELKSSCLELFSLWQHQRCEGKTDKVFRGMIADSLICLRILLRDYKKLRLSGAVIKVSGQVKAFSFGYKLNKNTFCILYEITDLSIKGIAQYIFQAFCSSLKDFSYINIMDDSGLDNLKKVKLSYRPVKLIRAYIATRR